MHPPIPILVGSQTGNGFHLAKLLSKTLKHAFILPVDQFDIPRINEFPFIIFIASTHGDGQPPFNMSKFYTLITTQRHPRLFKFKFAILGLGDSSYEKYNYCARITAEKLAALGAEMICRELCDSQDSNGIYDGYERFKSTVLEFLNRNALGYSTDNEEWYKKEYSVKAKKYGAKVIRNSLITPKEYPNKIYEIVLDIPEYSSFIPGDCISILPKNTLDLRQCFDFDETQIEYLIKNVDFFALIPQTAFKALSELAKSQRSIDKLVEISVDYDLYHEYVVIPRRNIFEIAQDFDVSLTFEFLRENLSEIYPRHFSCSKIDGCFHILYNLVEYKTYLSIPRHGLCTQYLARVEEGSTIDVEVQPSTLFLDDKKLLFFATGTGVTLPRSVIHHFDQNTKIINVFYGFRNKGKDQIHLPTYKSVDIHCASSRDDGRYVMDVYRENPVDNIEDWLVFVSGNSRLNKEIRRLLKEVHGVDVPIQSETW